MRKLIKFIFKIVLSIIFVSVFIYNLGLIIATFQSAFDTICNSEMAKTAVFQVEPFHFLQ